MNIARQAFFVLVIWMGASVSSAATRSGVASYYGEDPVAEHLNHHQADGSVFDPNALTCASWDYPFGTKLRVCAASGRCTVCEVRDRGPSRKLKHRVIDLTVASFKQLAPLSQGLVNVTVEQVNIGE